ncbi:MAG TPA: hypothetical protein PKD61_04315 [Polyangiaceae bacterium]|nr:hypothetical protein [Polyangiaceae bacterium]
MRRIFCVLAVVTCAGLLSGACGGSEPPDVVSNPDAATGKDGQGGETGSPEGGAIDASNDGVSDVVDPDAPVAPVRLGLRATPATSDAGVAPGDMLLAHLSVLSAGARVGIVHARWDQLFDAPASPVTTRWANLATTASAYRGAGAQLVACLSVVDRAQAARPTGVAGAWNAPANLQAGRALIDETFTYFGEELSVLSLGVEVDRYIAKSSTAEREELVGFVRHVFDYARQHPARPSQLSIGIGFNLSAVVAGPHAEIRELVDAGDVAVVSYVPLTPGFQVDSSNPLSDLDALHATLAGEAAPAPPIVLHEVALPSSADVQGSEAKQTAFFDAFFKALAARRQRHPIVVAAALHDGPQSDCVARAAAAETPPSLAAIAAHCSRGIRAESGMPKQAQSRVFEALAAFSSP